MALHWSLPLQSLNPIPYIAMWANCVAWLVYAFLTTDPYVLASNVPGVLIASFMAISCYGFADDKVRLLLIYSVRSYRLVQIGCGLDLGNQQCRCISATLVLFARQGL